MNSVYRSVKVPTRKIGHAGHAPAFGASVVKLAAIGIQLELRYLYHKIEELDGSKNAP